MYHKKRFFTFFSFFQSLINFSKNHHKWWLSHPKIKKKSRSDPLCLWMWMYVCTCTCACTCMCMYVYLNMYAHVNIHVHVHVHKHPWTYIYIYVHDTHTHIHALTHTYIHTCVCKHLSYMYALYVWRIHMSANIHHVSTTVPTTWIMVATTSMPWSSMTFRGRWLHVT